MVIFAFITAAFVSQCLIYYNFIVDDVYISLRYARNLANGHGLVFNTGDNIPVEGYTNFLWVLMEAPLFLLNLSDPQIIHVIRIIGILFGVGSLLIVYYLIRLLTQDTRTGLVGALFLAIIPEFSFWAPGGLETPMYIFWLLAGIYRYIYEKRQGKTHILSMIFLSLMALTRPEGLFFALAVICWDLLWVFRESPSNDERVRRAKQTIAGLMTFALIYGSYFLWRYNFYGYIFPNTFYAKKIAYAGQFLHRLKQVSSFLVGLFPLFAIASIGYFHFNKSGSRYRTGLLIMMTLLILFCFAARNEWMPGFRYELPFVPLLIVFFAVGVKKMLFDEGGRFGSLMQSRVTRFSALFFLGIFLLYDFNYMRKTGNAFSDQLHRAHVPLGKWLKKYAPQNASYASWDMGAVPYYSQLPNIIDINSEGLLNPHTTFRGYDVNHLISSNPSFLVLPPNTSYVRPKVILDFYSHEKLTKDYEFLFTIAFTEEYLLNVYRHRNIVLSDAALKEGRRIAERSGNDVD